MKVLTYVDLGRAFESLKKDIIDVEKKLRIDGDYPAAYGRLSAAAEFHVAWNTDTDFGFARKALETPEKTPESTYLYDQLNWKDPDDLKGIFERGVGMGDN